MPRISRYLWDRYADARFADWQADEPTVIAFDTETVGLGFHDPAFAATLTWRRPDGSLRSAYFDLCEEGRERRIGLVREMLTSTGHVVCHNLKFDAQKALLAGALTQEDVAALRWDDTQTVAHLLDENERKALKFLARTVLGIETNEEEVLKKVRRKLHLKKDDGYFHLPREVVLPYAERDTELTLMLYEKLMPQLSEDLLPVYEMEMDLTLALLDIEGRGFALNLDYLERTTSEYGVRVLVGWQGIVNLTGNPDLNPQSPKQLLEAFAARGVNLTSTAVAALKETDDELAGSLIEYRSDKKTHTTYLVPLLAEQRDGIVHPWFNTAVARTGRMSSSTASQ